MAEIIQYAESETRQKAIGLQQETTMKEKLKTLGDFMLPKMKLICTKCRHCDDLMWIFTPLPGIFRICRGLRKGPPGLKTI